MVEVGERIHLRIDSLAFQGPGVGRYNGIVVFVPFVAPEDYILAEITQVKKSYATARLLEVIESSPWRIPAPCPVFGECGGCHWQHIDYEQQLAQKEYILKQTLNRTLRLHPRKVLPIIPSPKIYRYRNRIDVQMTSQGAGFYQQGSNNWIQIDDCLIADESIGQSLQGLRQSVSSMKVPAKERQRLRLTAQGQKFSLPNSQYQFEQVNDEQNRRLIKTVIAWVGQMIPGIIIDLFCGQGNFTRPLAQRFPETPIVGVDNSPGNIKAANKHTYPSNLRFVCKDALQYLNSCPPQENSLVIVDPPRSGLSKLMVHRLCQSPPRHLLYISCDPMTLCRDLQRLQTHELQNWNIHCVQPLDMFPQTTHLETITILSTRLIANTLR